MPSPVPADPLASTRILAVCLTLLAAALLLSPVLSDPIHLALGVGASEGPSHLWGLWTTSSHMFPNGPFFRGAALNYPVGYLGDLIDPVSLVVFTPVWFLCGRGPIAAVIAWNTLHLATVCLAGWGGWRLGRRLFADPGPTLLVVAASAASPYLMASAALGRSEYLAGAWYPLHLAFLHAWLSPQGRRRDAVGAILTLIGLGWSGWTLALWVSVLEIPVSLAFCEQIEGWRERARRLGIVAIPAILGVLPFLASVLWLHPWWLARLTPGQYPGVPAMPLQDLFRFLQSYPVGGGVEIAPYPGTITVLLILVAFWIRPYEVLPWLIFAGSLLVLALGPQIEWATTGMPTWRGDAPVSWIMFFVPTTQAIQNWPRIAALLGGPLGAASAWAVVDPAARGRPLHIVLCALLGAGIVLDHWSWGERSTAAFTVTPPDDVTQALAGIPAGPILELPVDASSQEPQLVVWEDFSLLWQLQHGRPSSEVPSPTTAAAYTISVLASSLQSGRRPSASPCADSEQSRLYDAGFRGVVLQKRRVASSQGDAYVAAITSVLGAPTVTAGQTIAWALAEGDPVPARCKAPLSM